MLDAMPTFYETSYANVHRGVYQLAERATEALETRAREGARAPERAGRARGRSSSGTRPRAINLVAYAYGLAKLGPGDLVVVTELEHHSNFVPWQYVARPHRRGVPDDPARRQRRAPARRARRASPARARSRSSPTGVVSNSLGTMNPVERARRLGARARRRDGRRRRAGGAPPAGRRPGARLRLRSPISAHKMCGPSGVGALWGRAELLEAMEPFLTGGHMIRSVAVEETTWGELPHKFEAGTAPMAEAVGFGAAIDYLDGDRLRRDRAARARARRRTRSSGSPSCPG